MLPTSFSYSLLSVCADSGANYFAMKSGDLFIFHQQLLQDLLVADLAAGDPVQVPAGGFADRHAFGGKGAGYITQIAFVLSGGGEGLFCSHGASPYGSLGY